MRTRSIVPSSGDRSIVFVFSSWFFRFIFPTLRIICKEYSIILNGSRNLSLLQNGKASSAAFNDAPRTAGEALIIMGKLEGELSGGVGVRVFAGTHSYTILVERRYALTRKGERLAGLLLSFRACTPP